MYKGTVSEKLKAQKFSSFLAIISSMLNLKSYSKKLRAGEKIFGHHLFCFAEQLVLCGKHKEFVTFAKVEKSSIILAQSKRRALLILGELAPAKPEIFRDMILDTIKL